MHRHVIRPSTQAEWRRPARRRRSEIEWERTPHRRAGSPHPPLVRPEVERMALERLVYVASLGRGVIGHAAQIDAARRRIAVLAAAAAADAP
jgi:hypothetical protein